MSRALKPLAREFTVVCSTTTHDSDYKIDPSSCCACFRAPGLGAAFVRLLVFSAVYLAALRTPPLLDDGTMRMPAMRRRCTWQSPEYHQSCKTDSLAHLALMESCVHCINSEHAKL
jgi:hypothetical protein